MTRTVRLTTAQALVKFLANQYSERDGTEQRLVTGMLGIFGHGSVAGVGQALLQARVQTEEGAEGEGPEHRVSFDGADHSAGLAPNCLVPPVWGS